jgi:DNA invertase Pin-like site-specific DNA recombinase
MEKERDTVEGENGFSTRKLETLIDRLERVVIQAEQQQKTAGRPSTDWKTAARIWYANVRETVTYRDLATRFKVGESTVRRICSSTESPAEIEYTKQTGLNADDDVQAFIKWKDQYL